MTLKRPRASPEAAEEDARDGAMLQELQPFKKARLDTPSLTLPFPAQRDRISCLSDELLVRILSLLNVPQLLDVSLVSHRFSRLACDSHLWKALYYTRFVLPRALRIPGFRADGKTKNAQRQQHKLHYTGRRALWADGRRGGIVRDHHLEAEHVKGQLAKKKTSAQDSTEVQEPVDWKRQFRLRHNWAKGNCAVKELRLGDGNNKQTHHRMLVKVVEGIAITADAESGLRAWNLKTRKIMAQTSLQPPVTPPAAYNDSNDAGGMPSCLAVDDDLAPDGQTLRIALGFCDGSFGVWTLDIKRGGEASVLEPQYRHEPSSSGRLVGMAYSHPFLLTATESVLVSLYTFEGPDSPSGAEVNKWPSPHLLTSLTSHTSEPPLALSVRRAGATTTIASIAYTVATRQGWSIGVQDLHIKTGTPDQLPEIGSTR
ncbi:F-box domain-containing protein, partial [Magnaporthiopsis poae ATCC 64411]